VNLNEDQFSPQHARDNGLNTSLSGVAMPTEHEDRQAVVSMMRKASDIHGVGPEGVKVHDWHRLSTPNDRGESHWAVVGSGEQGLDHYTQLWHNPETGDNSMTWDMNRGTQATTRRNGPLR
jgi:hypothetical protein